MWVPPVVQMQYTEYHDAQAFLKKTQPAFEEREALFGLMLGISLRLVENPSHYGGTFPFLATVSDGEALQLIALMTPPHKLQIASFVRENEKAVGLLAHHLNQGQWEIPAVLAEEQLATCFAANWSRLTGVQHEVGTRQRIYQLRTVNVPVDPGGDFRPAVLEDLGFLAQWTASFHEDCYGRSDFEQCTKTARAMIENRDLYVWEDPHPVSMAGFTRPTKNGISIAAVYTPPEFRKSGYASALVASLSACALESGKTFCTLYTDLSNPTSNSIYQKIGYEPVADVMDVNFNKRDCLK